MVSYPYFSSIQYSRLWTVHIGAVSPAAKCAAHRSNVLHTFKLRTTHPDQNRGPAIMAIFWTETMVAFFFVMARFYSRIKIRGLGIDDWIMLLAIVRNKAGP